MKTRNIYLTRDTGIDYVEIRPDTVGIRKFHGCIQWGSAWQGRCPSTSLTRRDLRDVPDMYKTECKRVFGFYPRPGTAWHIDGRGKKTKVDIDFSN